MNGLRPIFAIAVRTIERVFRVEAVALCGSLALAATAGPACSSNEAPPVDVATTPELPGSGGEPEPVSPGSGDVVANVTSVSVSGTAGAYRFSVTLESPDTGCEQYADWWEVITDEGELVYRRILAHSHVDEQPFTRSGGPVNVEPGTAIIVRGHMNEGGYGGTVFAGTVESGLAPRTSGAEPLAPDLASSVPLPDGCAF